MSRLVLRKPVIVSELVPVLFLAIGVSIAFTIGASVFQRVHQVAAEEQVSPVVKAVAAENNTQVLTFTDWSAQLVLPLGKDMPLMSYAGKGTDSVGLSSESLAKIDPACSVQANALGSILRLPAGSLAHFPATSQTRVFLANVEGYDFVYQLPQSSCSAKAGVAGMVAQAEAAIQGVGVVRAITQ